MKKFLLITEDCNGTQYFFGDSFYECLDKYVEFDDNILMDADEIFHTLFYNEWDGVFIELLDLESEKELDINELISEDMNKQELIEYCKNWDKEYLENK